IVVNHVGNIVYVKAARGDIGRDEHLYPAFLKTAQGGVALRLRTITMDHAGAETIAHQFLSEPFCATLRAREDQSLSFFCIEQLAKNVDLFSRTHFVRLEFD